jgi:hypothetical protein
MKKWVTILRNKYFLIVVVVITVFMVVWRTVDLQAAIFYSVLTAVVLFFVTFDPRIKRHW